MKRVLITGSEGFVGGHLINELSVHGYEIYGSVKEKKINHIPNNYVCDITSYTEVIKLLSEVKPDYIVHLAGIASPGFSFKEPQTTLEVNTVGTLNILEAIKNIENYHPRLLLIGTAEEYGFVSEDQLPVTEETSFNPANPYAVSKLANYFLSKIYHRSYQMDIIYSASFNHTGPGQNPGFLAPDVASQIVNIEKKIQEPTLITGNLNSFRDYTDVRDVVRAYRLLLEKGKSGERYNVCSGVSIESAEVVKILLSYSHQKISQTIDPSRNRPSEMRVFRGSNKKIFQDTGWKAEIKLEDTLRDLLDWYRDRG